MQNITIAIIACAKHEELYIKEWIDWNLKIGVDHIFIADNNEDTYTPILSDVIKEYIDNGIVTIYNYNNIHPIQPICYSEIYEKHGYDYDWFYICDIDEFLHIPITNNDIKKFVQMPLYKTFDSIAINWRSYDDNDLLFYDDRPVQERFTRIANTKNVPNGERYITKNIFKSKRYNKDFFVDHQHDPLARICKCRRCNVLGTLKQKNTVDYHNDYSEKYKIAYIAHFEQKTLDEYVKKISRGSCHKKFSNIDCPYKLHTFWNINNKTPEKLEFYEKIKNQL